MNIRITPPADFLREEIKCGYTISAEMKKVWAVQIDLMHALLDVCNRHGLRIYADGGTMLGAIRHQGFIPWDDDIDMVMMREDYDKLMSLAHEFSHPYFLQNVYTDPHYTHRHAQLRNSDTACWASDKKGCSGRCNEGIFIDIFPSDFLPITPRHFSRYYKKESMAKQKFRLVSKFANAMPEPVYRWMRNSTKCLSDKARFADYEAVLRSNPKNTSACVCEMAFNHVAEIHPYKDYGEPQMVPFEYTQIPVPQNADALLTRQYGDYMTPAKAPSYHGSLCFDTERSYLISK